MIAPLALLTLLTACSSAPDTPAPSQTAEAVDVVGGADAPEAPRMAATTWFLLRGSVTVEVAAGEQTHTATASLYNGGLRTLSPDTLVEATGTTQIVHETWRSADSPDLARALADGCFVASSPYLPLSLTQVGDALTLTWEHPSGPRNLSLGVSMTEGISTNTLTLGPASLTEALPARERRDIARAIGVAAVDDITLAATMTVGEDSASTGVSRRAPGTLPAGDGDDRPLWEEHPIRRSGAPRGGRESRGGYREGGSYNPDNVELSPENVDATGR